MSGLPCLACCHDNPTLYKWQKMSWWMFAVWKLLHQQKNFKLFCHNCVGLIKVCMWGISFYWWCHRHARFVMNKRQKDSQCHSTDCIISVSPPDVSQIVQELMLYNCFSQQSDNVSVRSFRWMCINALFNTVILDRLLQKFIHVVLLQLAKQAPTCSMGNRH